MQIPAKYCATKSRNSERKTGIPVKAIKQMSKTEKYAKIKIKLNSNERLELISE